MAQPHLFFRIVYGSVYFFLCVILLGLLLITPGDAIERSISNRQQYNVWILIISYVVTAVVVGFIYLLRLYVNKTVLASIPKAWIPVDKGDVTKAVHKVISAGLSRSAVIAYEARPRANMINPNHEVEDDHNPTAGRRHHLLNRIRSLERSELVLPPHPAPWAKIEHYGWSSPNAADLSNLEYSSVLSELPNLIEARALTMAPPDSTSGAESLVLDPEAASLLQRPPHLSLRGYFASLMEIDVLDMDETTTSFLQQYEYARFSTRPISFAQFKQLMHLFAEILRSMRPLDLGMLDEMESVSEDYASFESDIDSDAPLRTDPSTPRSNRSRAGTVRSQGSIRRTYNRNSSLAPGLFSTAPNTPKDRKSSMAVSRKSSNHSGFAQTRRPYPVSQPSSASLRSKASASTASGGSVIRLATEDDATDSPYVITMV